jgi:predicted negative regulator of RcsB-dependent stress response
LRAWEKPEEALKEMNEARGTMTYVPELTHEIGHLLERQGNLDAAIKEYQASLNLNPSQG